MMETKLSVCSHYTQWQRVQFLC